MKQRIVERHRIKKGTYFYNSYNGLGDYLATKGCVAIILLPFILIFYIYKYIFIGIIWIIKQISNTIYNLFKMK